MNPLMKTEDAFEIDTSDITIEEQVKKILDRVRLTSETLAAENEQRV